MDKLQKLKAIAEKATPGPWSEVRYEEFEQTFRVLKKVDCPEGWNHGSVRHLHQAVFDENHIATFSPDTVLKLIEVIQLYEKCLHKFIGNPETDCLTATNVENRHTATEFSKICELLNTIEVPNE